MKVRNRFERFDAPMRIQRQGAFTLPEVMVTAAVSLLVMTGLITTYLFGLRLLEFTKPKLSASDEARSIVGVMANEVRSAHLIRIGQGGRTAFSEIPVGVRQEGNAIQIYRTTNLADFVRYYHNPTDRTLMRLAGGSASPRIVANCVSNTLVFSAEDFSGQVITNNQNNRVIGLLLQFYQIQYPAVKIGPGEFYDFYQLRSKFTRRKIL